MLAGSIVWLILGDGPTLLVPAAIVGFVAGLLLVFWALGDVNSLSWLWGSQGEQLTAELLEQLDARRWHVEHDLPRKRGNWDHVVTGYSGTFLLETKNLSRGSSVANDALVSGRLRYRGAEFRASAAELATARRDNGRRPWVQPVVVIWRRIKENGVVYLAAAELVPWLESQPAAH
jgi:hypothetical protein